MKEKLPPARRRARPPRRPPPRRADNAEGRECMLTKVDGATADGPWVDAARGLVSREIFFSDEIYRLELERIFKKVWLYVAHDSEIPNPGDFVTRQMGD